MSDIIIIDIEASGLHPDSYPIEIAVLIEGCVYSWLIKPEVSWTYWNKTAESIHGLTRKYLEENGLPAQQVADELNKQLMDTSGLLYSDAAEWDTDWINTLYLQVGTIPQFHILPVQDLLSDKKIALFQETVNKIAASGKYRRHRAGDDVQIINAALTSIT